jgi:hypothetical protein
MRYITLMFLVLLTGCGWGMLPVTHADSTTAMGVVTLGPATASVPTAFADVSSESACTPSSSCVYTLTNCGFGASTGIGILSLQVSAIQAGTSFRIISTSPDERSTVCWRIN